MGVSTGAAGSTGGIARAVGDVSSGSSTRIDKERVSLQQVESMLFSRTHRTLGFHLMQPGWATLLRKPWLSQPLMGSLARVHGSPHRCPQLSPNVFAMGKVVEIQEQSCRFMNKVARIARLHFDLDLHHLLKDIVLIRFYVIMFGRSEIPQNPHNTAAEPAESMGTKVAQHRFYSSCVISMQKLHFHIKAASIQQVMSNI